MTETAAHAQWRANAPKKLVAVKLIVKSEKGRILLVKPTYKPTWQFPGGGVELSEAPVEALIREVNEELGMKVKEQEDKLVGVVFQPKDDAVLIIYEFQRNLDESTVLQLQKDELEAYQFASPTEVPGLVADCYHDFWVGYSSR